MLSRLGVRQKLGLLLVLPFTAVVCAILPFSVERVDQARLAAATAAKARQARQVGDLVQQLQQERLLTLAALHLPTLDRAALLRQQLTVVAATAALRAQDGGALTPALDQVASLQTIRHQALTGVGSLTIVYAHYHDAIEALLDGLGLVGRSDVDATGLRELEAIDALLRANEQASSVGAALVVAAADPADGVPLLAAADNGEDLQGQRFKALARPDETAQLDTVDNGPAGQQIAVLIGQLGPAGTGGSQLDRVVAAAQSYTALRQLLEDGIASGSAHDADRRASGSQLAAATVTVVAVLVLILVVALSVRVSRSIAAPLRRLTRAATTVADIAGIELHRVADSDEQDPDPPRLAAVNVQSHDEIGELATAFNRVEATAALLLERQVVTRRNVSVMFSTIARRTQGLVARQLAVIDEMERNETNSDVLERLYRLDHLSTRLRRSADSLLVVAGVRDDLLATSLPLIDVVRAAMAEVEGFRDIRLGQVCDVTIGVELADDLRLLLAELLENAVAVSPPGTPVDVGAHLDGSCRIVIVDYGIGMSAERIAEENLRLRERQRLDLAPPSVLGLFVVGRLARRHGLEVELAATPGQGITVSVTVPPRLFESVRRAAALEPPTPGANRWSTGTRAHMLPSQDPQPDYRDAAGMGNGGHPRRESPRIPPMPGAPAMPGMPPMPAIAPMPVISAPPAAMSAEDQTFSWFPRNSETISWNGPTTQLAQTVTGASGGQSHPPRPPVAVPPSPVPRASGPVPSPSRSAPPAIRGGLTRRVPGQRSAAFAAGTPTAAPVVMRDADAERAQLEGFAQADRLAGRVPMPAAEPQPIAGSGNGGPAVPAAAEEERTTGTDGGADRREVSWESGGGGSRPQRGGLTRRVPGSHLNRSASPVHRAPAPDLGAVPTEPVRNAAAERDQLAGFLDGYARGARRHADD